MNRACSILLASTVAASTLWAGETDVTPKPDLPCVLLIGDSISMGYTAETQKILEGRAEVRRAPGNCGPTTRGVASLDSWLGDGRWDVIHFNFGLHDIKYVGTAAKRILSLTAPGTRRQVLPDDYEKNLRLIVERLQDTGARLIWCATTPVPEGESYRVPGDEVEYNRIATRVMEEYGIPIHDLHAFVQPRMKELQLPANVHFTPAGSQALAAQVANAVIVALQTPAAARDDVPTTTESASIFLPVVDETLITRHNDGDWAQGGGAVDGRARNRYTWPFHLRTKTRGARLTIPFDGTGLAVVFHTPRVRAYGSQWRNGRVRVTVDDRPPVEFVHDAEALEVVAADQLPPGPHLAIFEHVTNGCTLAGFRVFRDPVGHLAAVVEGDNPDFLFDVRVSIWQDDRLVRTSLNRNWLSNRIALTGLPPGDRYRVRIKAVGWEAWERDGIHIRAGETVDLGSIHLRQDPATVRGPIPWPALGAQAISVPGASIDIRADVDDWATARLVRRSGPATISRVATVKGRTLQVPDDMPPGVYDLHLTAEDGQPVVSPRSVVVRRRHAAGDLTILTWGHTDTWGQHQAEFERALIRVANAIGPDLVLVSNSLNPAYVAGAMAELGAPYMINFGNHALRDYENWFGRHVGLLPMGPNFVVFNWGLRWREDTAELDSMMAAHYAVPGKILNTFESDFPLDLFNRHDVRLVHDAHGWLKPRVLVLPDTQTMRVGKQTASSFRIVRMADHRVTSVTDPLEVPRIDNPLAPRVPDPPLRIVYNGNMAEVINELPVPIPRAHVVMVLPHGGYSADNADIESETASDDGHWIEIVLRTDVAAESTREVALHLQP